MIVLGVDPGSDGALSLVEVPAEGRGRLLGGWPLYGAGPPRRRRLRLILDEVGRLCHEPDLLALEEPAAGGAQRAEVRAARGPSTWLGLGWYAGQVEGACCYRWSELPVVRIGSGDWPRRLAIRPGKAAYAICSLPRGWHRVGEARTLLEGDWPADPARLASEAQRQVALAEAALIAVAVGWRWQQGGE